MDTSRLVAGTTRLRKRSTTIAVFGDYYFVRAFDFGEQGWRSGDCTRLPPTWPGFGPRVG